MSETAEKSDPTALPTVSGVVDLVGDGWIELRVPGTDYRLRLVPAEGLSAKAGDKVTGVVRAQALRMDVVPAGGRYIEPVQGRPRRIQGRVIGGSVTHNAVYVKAGPSVAVTPLAPQRAGDFSIGQMVSFDVRAGATIEAIEK